MIAEDKILIVDDYPLVQALLTDILSAEGFQVQSADSGKQALHSVEAEPPKLILLDIDMPDMDGFEVCLRLKAQDEGCEIPVIFLSGITDVNAKEKGFGLGAVDFISKIFQRDELLARVRNHLELSRLRTNLDITERKKGEEELKQGLDKLHRAMKGIIQAMALTLETRDPYTAGHQRRVADLARSIGQEMGLTKDQVEAIRMAGMVHDLGKISLPAEILSKPTTLSSLEFGLIRVHPQISYNILKDIDFPWPIAKIVYQHHERINGSGYPLGLTGGEILLEAKVLMVADVVEAIASHRPYRPALGIDVALEKISRNEGRIYDPEVVKTCLKLFREKGFKLE